MHDILGLYIHKATNNSLQNPGSINALVWQPEYLSDISKLQATLLHCLNPPLQMRIPIAASM